MFKITIETEDRTISIADYDIGEDTNMGDIIPMFQEILMALGYHPNCVSDAFSDDYNLWLSNTCPADEVAENSP